MQVEVESSPKFDILYDLPKDINLIICIGGRGGMKTYEISKFCAVQATIKKKRIVVLRDEKALIKETILNEIWARYDTANEDGILDQFYIKNETELKDKKTGKTLIYTKGFRASDSKKQANLKGTSDIDIAVVEEGEDLRDKDKFYTFIDGLRKQGCVVIYILNVPDTSHFIIQNYFNTLPLPTNIINDLVSKGVKENDLDGYYKIEPKKSDGVLVIETNYIDNVDSNGINRIPKHVTDRYEAYGNPKHELYDLHRYLTQTKGFSSSGRKGQILKKVKPISLKEYMALPYKEFYGQDFGTSAPAGMVGVKFYKNNCYCRQLNYLPMSIKDIGILYCNMNFSSTDKIVVDYADPEWRKLRDGFKKSDLSDEDIIKYPKLLKGFYIKPCSKGIDTGISLMNSLNLFAVEESKDLWDEIRQRVYAQDKNGNYTNDPAPGFDHLIDPWTYVVVDQKGWKAGEAVKAKTN